MLQICGLMVCQVPRVVVSLIKILLFFLCILQFSPQILENIQLKKSKYIQRKICVRMVEQVPRVVVSLIGSSAVHRTVFLYFGNRHLIALHCCAVVCCKERERVELRCEGESCQKWRSSPMIAIMIIIIQSQKILFTLPTAVRVALSNSRRELIGSIQKLPLSSGGPG